MFELLPAIDLTEGRLGRYTPQGPVPVGAFDGDPLAAAAAFVAAGARWLHVVDMDRAFTGSSDHGEVVTAIRAAHPSVGLQCSGGVRDGRAADGLLAAGASRVVLSSAALADEGATAAAIEDLAGRLVVGIEIEQGRIRSRGRDPVDLDMMATLGWLTAAGAHAFLVTAVTRIGSAEGPDLDTIARVARTGRPTIAAGGIGSLGDVRAVRGAGASGAVVGSAALRGTLDLRAALDLAQTLAG